MGRIKLADQLERRVGVVDVVIGQLLTLMLLGGGDTGTRAAIGVECRTLMRVFAVTQALRQSAGKAAAARGAVDLGGHPCADGSVIGRSAPVSRLCQTLPQGIGGLTVVGLKLGQHNVVIFDVDHDVHKPVVLGRRADHRRAADVDVLDDFIIGRALGDGFLERVEVDHHQINRTDVVGVHRRAVVGIVTQGQQTAVHHRVQRLDPPVHHLGIAGDIRHVLDLQTSRTQRRRGAAGAQQFDPPRGQGLTEWHEAGLVRYGNQRAAHGIEVGGHGNQQPFCGLVGHIKFISGQVPDANGSLLRLGQGPANAGGILHCAPHENNLLCRTWL